MNILVVGLGGFLGAVSRYWIYLAVNAQSWGRFPLATLIVNVVGCLVLGAWMGYLRGEMPTQNSFALFLTVGFLGAFTTFSAFSLDTVLLFDSGLLGQAILNMALNMALCLAAIVGGRALSEVILR